MTAYTIEIRMYEEEWDARFSFTAADDNDAKNKAQSWARYQGMSYGNTKYDDVRFREATTHEAEHLNNEYLR